MSQDYFDTKDFSFWKLSIYKAYKDIQVGVIPLSWKPSFYKKTIIAKGFQTLLNSLKIRRGFMSPLFSRKSCQSLGRLF
jgi:hypothetical protein